jgi:hypothetical protein
MTNKCTTVKSEITSPTAAFEEVQSKRGDNPQSEGLWSKPNKYRILTCPSETAAFEEWKTYKEQKRIHNSDDKWSYKNLYHDKYVTVKNNASKRVVLHNLHPILNR